MAYFVIPSKKEFEKNRKKNGFMRTYEDTYDDEFTCDICGKRLIAGDRYIMVRTDAQVKADGKPAFRHCLCDLRANAYLRVQCINQEKSLGFNNH